MLVPAPGARMSKRSNKTKSANSIVFINYWMQNTMIAIYDCSHIESETRIMPLTLWHFQNYNLNKTQNACNFTTFQTTIIGTNNNQQLKFNNCSNHDWTAHVRSLKLRLAQAYGWNIQQTCMKCQHVQQYDWNNATKQC